MKPKALLATIFLGLSVGLPGETVPDGANLFTTNCSACHLLDQSIVGPSLVEIRSLYLNKPDEFLKWTIAPGRKRAGAIEMPSMVHVGEPGLRAIHTYIMSLSKGVKTQKAVTTDPFANSPTQNVRPLVQRIFLPDAGPAAIGVALDAKTSLCWDAGECRLRYVWTGGFIDGFPYWKGNGSSQAKIKGKVRYIEPAPLISGAPKFKGYQIKDGLPIFHYSLGNQEITETFTALDSGGINRAFTIFPLPAEDLVIRLPQSPKVNTICDKGILAKGKLILTPEQAARFTLTHRFQ
jgi:cytochrome c551/c552